MRRSAHASDVDRWLCDPFVVRVRGATGQVNAAAADFDEEQHAQSLKPDRIDGEEVHRDNAASLGAQEFAP